MQLAVFPMSRNKILLQPEDDGHVSPAEVLFLFFLKGLSCMCCSHQIFALFAPETQRTGVDKRGRLDW